MINFLKSSFPYASNLSFNANNWDQKIGVFGLYVFAFFAFLGVAGAHIGLGFMALGILFQWRQFWTALRQDTLLGIMAWATLAVTISAGLAVMQRPQELSTQMEAAMDFVKLWQFLLVAWWLQGRQQRLLIMLALALAGFLLGCIRALDEVQLQALLDFERPNFKWSINAFGQYSAAGLLGLLVMAPRLWDWSQQHLWRRWIGFLGLFGLPVLLLQGVFFSQSRGAWFALVAVLIILYGYVTLTRSSYLSKIPRSFQIGAALLILAVILVNGTVIIQRFGFFDASFLQQLWSGDIEHISDVALQQRMVMINIGVEYWLQKFWFGWGLGAAPHIFQANADQLITPDNYGDFHNILIDLLVGVGVFGTMSVLLLLLMVIRVLYQANRNHFLDEDTYLLILGLLILNVLCQLTDFRILSIHGRFYWLLVVGGAYACRLAQVTHRNSSVQMGPGDG